jgi:hypothetical protein
MDQKNKKSKTPIGVFDKKEYLKYPILLWTWGIGNPHRSALDTPVKESTNAPQ